MKLFLDTSSLFKLYHQEADSAIVERLFIDYRITGVFLSELTKVEFVSSVWKKVRVNEISEVQASALIKAFENDFGKYQFVQLDSLIIEDARNLLSKYGALGLRTLDSLQLSAAILLKGQVALFKTSDHLLETCLKLESLPTERPVV